MFWRHLAEPMERLHLNAKHKAKAPKNFDRKRNTGAQLPVTDYR